HHRGSRRDVRLRRADPAPGRQRSRRNAVLLPGPRRPRNRLPTRTTQRADGSNRGQGDLDRRPRGLPAPSLAGRPARRPVRRRLRPLPGKPDPSGRRPHDGPPAVHHVAPRPVSTASAGSTRAPDGSGSRSVPRPELQTHQPTTRKPLSGWGKGLVTGSSKSTGHGVTQTTANYTSGHKAAGEVPAWTRLTSKIPSWVASRFRAPMVGQECSSTAGAEQSDP